MPNYKFKPQIVEIIIKIDLKKINTLYNCRGFEQTGGGHGGGAVVTTEPPVTPVSTCKDTHK